MTEKKIVIIGGGLTSLTLGHWLSRQGCRQLQLLEATDSLGGRFRGDTSELNAIAPTPEALGALEWLKSLTPISWNQEDVAPVFYESNEWKPFLGFGDFPSTVVNELSNLNQHRFLNVENGLRNAARALIEQLPFEARLRAEVTGFEYKDGAITAALVNGQERVPGDVFIFTPSAHLLVKLLPDEAIKPAHRSKLAKHQGWTSATMTLHRKDPLLTEAGPEPRFVLGSGKEFEPVVGRVWPTHSVWMNLISSEKSEDLEHVGDCVRYIKRTLKRVWPELIDQMSSESIRVRPHAYGKLDLKLKDLSFPELPNFKIADARLSGVWGDLGAAAMGQELSTLFVAQPQNPVLSDSEAIQTT